MSSTVAVCGEGGLEVLPVIAALAEECGIGVRYLRPDEYSESFAGAILIDPDERLAGAWPVSLPRIEVRTSEFVLPVAQVSFSDSEQVPQCFRGRKLITESVVSHSALNVPKREIVIRSRRNEDAIARVAIGQCSCVCK